MRKFFSVWLILLVIIAFAIALLVSYPVLTAQAEQTASEDLNVLLDAAFTRISLAEDSAKAVADASDDNVLSKARAIDRFLSHDDALLQTDALLSLCDLLNVSSIDVTGMDGEIIASSTGARIGRNLVDDRNTAWTKEVLEGENLSRTLVDAQNTALLSGCVSRTDTEGLIFIQSLDVAIMEAATAASPEQVLLDMSFMKDGLAVADAEGDFSFAEDDAYIVTRTQDGVTLSAARPLTQVYAVRSAVLFVEAIGFLLCMLFAIVIQFLLIKKRLSSRAGAALSASEAETDAIVAAEIAADSASLEADTLPEDMPEGGDIPEETPAEPQKRAARRERKPRQKIFEFVDIDEDERSDENADEDSAQEPPDEAAAEAEAGIRALWKPRRKKRAKHAREDAPGEQEAALAAATETLEETLAAPGTTDAAEIAAEAAEEFAAPQAVIEEPVEEERPKRRGKRAKPAGDEPAETPAESAKAARAPKPRRKKQQEEAADADGAFDKIFD